MSRDYDYMQVYRDRVVEMSKDLTILLDAVMQHPDELPLGSFTKYAPEPAFIGLARRIGLVKTERETYQVRGVRVQQGTHTIALIGRHGNPGRPVLVVQDSASKHRVSEWTPDYYVQYIITDDRWVTMNDAVLAFSGIYDAIAKLLPASHALHARAAKLSTEADELRERRARMR